MAPDPVAPPLLLATRFGLGIKDPAWFEHRLALVSAITIPSILAQGDQGLRWAWFVDDDLPRGVRERLEEMLSPFEGRAFLETAPYVQSRLLRLVEEQNLIDPGGRALTARIDDDDAWCVKTVGSVRGRVTEWASSEAGSSGGLGITFNQGLEWVMYDMLDIDRLQEKGRRVIHPAAVRAYTYPFHSMSVHVYAPVSDGMTALGSAHSRMAENLRGRGYAVEEVRTDKPMWLYCRHKQIDSSVKKARGQMVELTVGDLAERFGIDESRTDAYRRTAEKHGYALLKRPPQVFGEIKRRLAEIRRQARAADGERAARLEEEERRIEGELARVAANVVGDPEGGEGQTLRWPSELDGDRN